MKSIEMKTKGISILILILLIGFFNSCQKSEIAEYELRTLQQDVEVLYHFVCIDREVLRYYLAFGTDNDHFELIPKEIIVELEKVSAMNLIQFYEDLEYLNSQLKEEAKRDDTVIVLSTLYDEYESL